MARIFISAVASTDGVDLIRAHVESRAYHHPWVSTFTDQAGFEAWFARHDPQRMVSLIARRESDGEVVGLCTLSEIVRGMFQSAYLGFHGMVAFARQGLMTEAVRLTAQYAFAELHLHRLEANIQPENAASIALVRCVGFAREGYSRDYLKIDGAWRDHERWALLASDNPS